AAVVQRVERARLRGRTSTPLLYLRATAGHLAYTNRLGGRRQDRPAITVEVPGESGVTELATVIVQNTAPWTYLGDRPIDPNPEASFDLGLDVMAMRALKLVNTARTFGQMLTGRRAPHGRQVVRWHDLSELTLYADPPQPFQVDGDYL